MILVQLILVTAFAVLFVGALRSRTALSVSAWTKMAFAGLMVVVVVAVLSPALVTAVANAVGVGRGTDLVLYMVSVAFGYYVVTQYLRSQEMRHELHRLARQVAIVEALERYGLERTRERDHHVIRELGQDPTPDPAQDDTA